MYLFSFINIYEAPPLHQGLWWAPGLQTWMRLTEGLGLHQRLSNIFESCHLPSKEQKPNMQDSFKLSCSKLKQAVCGGEGRAGRMGASSVGYLRKFHGFPEHVWKHWHGWRFRCLCDRDVRFLWFKHRAHYERGGLWGIKNEETVQISECPPWRMLIGFLGSQEFVCRQETIVMYICYSACISCRIKLLPLVLLYF